MKLLNTYLQLVLCNKQHCLKTESSIIFLIFSDFPHLSGVAGCIKNPLWLVTHSVAASTREIVKAVEGQHDGGAASIQTSTTPRHGVPRAPPRVAHESRVRFRPCLGLGLGKASASTLSRPGRGSDTANRPAAAAVLRSQNPLKHGCGMPAHLSAGEPGAAGAAMSATLASLAPLSPWPRDRRPRRLESARASPVTRTTRRVARVSPPECRALLHMCGTLDSESRAAALPRRQATNSNSSVQGELGLVNPHRQRRVGDTQPEKLQKSLCIKCPVNPCKVAHLQSRHQRATAKA